jgi:regulation of enolase protein 1 (concanavalin A-like superfamily)
MSDALAATGRPIVYALCEWGNFSPWQWGPYQANLGRSTGDISPSFGSMLSNFTINAENPPSPDAPRYFNDPDMLEIGTGNFSTLAADAPAGATNIKVASTSRAIVGGLVRIGTAAAGDLESAVVTNVGTAGAAGTGLTLDRPLTKSHPSGEQINKDGMTLTEEQTEQSLWAAEAAPLLAGTDVVNMAPQDLKIYENPDVIAVDQDPLGVQATVVSNANGKWVLSKPLADGSHAVVLFNATGTAQTITASAAAAGLPGGSTGYNLKNLWTHQSIETAGVIGASVPAHGAVMYRVTPASNPAQVPPDTTLDVGGLSAITTGQPATATVTFTDDGVQPAQQIKLSLTAPAGWSVTPTSPTTFGSVDSGQAVRSTFQVVAPASDGLFESDQLNAAASYTWPGHTPQAATASATVMRSSPPVQAPYRTTASTSPAYFGQQGGQFGIATDGTDVWTGNDEYGAIYQPGAAGTQATAVVKVDSQDAIDPWSKAGIMLRDDATKAGSSAGYAMIAVTPGNGIAFQWDSDGNGYLDSDINVGANTAPVWLKLVRSGSTVTAYYSTDGQTWTTVGSATIPGTQPAEDVGMFSTSHAPGTVGQALFSNYSITS